MAIGLLRNCEIQVRENNMNLTNSTEQLFRDVEDKMIINYFIIVLTELDSAGGHMF